MLTIYPACFYKEEDGYSVIFPDLNHLATCGDNLEEAMYMAIDALAGYIYDEQKVAIRSLKHRSSLRSTRFPTIEISTRKQSLGNALSLM